MTKTPWQITQQRLEFEELVKDIRMLGVLVEPELVFSPPRKWAFDLAFPELMYALEIEGLGGRHQQIGGFLGDMEKYREAELLGWHVLRCTRREVGNGTALKLVTRAMERVVYDND